MVWFRLSLVVSKVQIILQQEVMGSVCPQALTNCFSSQRNAGQSYKQTTHDVEISSKQPEIKPHNKQANRKKSSSNQPIIDQATRKNIFFDIQQSKGSQNIFLEQLPKTKIQYKTDRLTLAQQKSYKFQNKQPIILEYSTFPKNVTNNPRTDLGTIKNNNILSKEITLINPQLNLTTKNYISRPNNFRLQSPPTKIQENRQTLVQFKKDTQEKLYNNSRPYTSYSLSRQNFKYADNSASESVPLSSFNSKRQQVNRVNVLQSADESKVMFNSVRNVIKSKQPTKNEQSGVLKRSYSINKELSSFKNPVKEQKVINRSLPKDQIKFQLLKTTKEQALVHNNHNNKNKAEKLQLFQIKQLDHAKIVKNVTNIKTIFIILPDKSQKTLDVQVQKTIAFLKETIQSKIYKKYCLDLIVLTLNKRILADKELISSLYEDQNNSEEQITIKVKKAKVWQIKGLKSNKNKEDTVSLTKGVAYTNCKHFFSRQTLKENINYQVNIQKKNQICCPFQTSEQPKCDKILDLDFCILVAGFSIKETDWITTQMNFNWTLKNCKKCPLCSEMILNIKEGDKKVQCPVCRKTFCLECNMLWRYPYSKFCKSKQCFQRLQSQKMVLKNAPWTRCFQMYTFPDLQTFFKVQTPNMRACPRCHSLIMNTNNCKHTPCPCTTDQIYSFCFVCLSLPVKGNWSCGGSHEYCGKVTPNT